MPRTVKIAGPLGSSDLNATPFGFKPWIDVASNGCSSTSHVECAIRGGAITKPGLYAIDSGFNEVALVEVYSSVALKVKR